MKKLPDKVIVHRKCLLFHPFYILSLIGYHFPLIFLVRRRLYAFYAKSSVIFSVFTIM